MGIIDIKEPKARRLAAQWIMVSRRRMRTYPEWATGPLGWHASISATLATVGELVYVSGLDRSPGEPVPDVVHVMTGIGRALAATIGLQVELVNPRDGNKPITPTTH